MIVFAEAKSVRISPKKAREVAPLLSGHKVDDAMTILEHTPRKAAKFISKVLASAKANATHNYSLKEDSLIVSSVEIYEAGSYKRWRPAARGRALSYKHKLSHIKINLLGDKEVKKIEAKPESTAKKEKTNPKDKEKK